MNKFILSFVLLLVSCTNQSMSNPTSFCDMDGTWSGDEHIEYSTEGSNGAILETEDRSGEVLFNDQFGSSVSVNGDVAFATEDGIYFGSERFYGKHPSVDVYYVQVTDGYVDKVGGTIVYRYDMLDSVTNTRLYWLQFTHTYKNLVKTRKF